MDITSREFLQSHGLLVVSNRGPVQFRFRNGELQSTRGSGGLVTAITSLSRLVPFTWIASALSEGDRHAARNEGSIPVGKGRNDELFVRYVLNSPDAYNRYYNVFSNPFLWFLQHYMFDLIYDNINREVNNAWFNGYVPVNNAFADAVIKEAENSDKPPVVMIQDYQLYLVGGSVRRGLTDAIVQHFIHIPWPAPRYWAMLPKHIRESILSSLCSCDIVGFQTRRDAENFVATCEDLLPGAEVNLKTMTVRYRNQTTFARHYPVSINPSELGKVVETSLVREYGNKLAELVSGKTIVRVDRLDPTKNILRGFKAFELLLSTHLEFLGKVTFLAFLVPSRTEIVQYQRYKEAVLDQIERINQSFGTDEWTPVHLFYEENYHQALAGMRMADVLIVNPIMDGMNLVAKEAPIVSARNCVLVLSETIGAFEQLKEYVVPVSPVDVEGTADALYEALTMGEKERERRIQGLREGIEREDITHWLNKQIQDLSYLAR